jgi:hypothetical protein
MQTSSKRHPLDEEFIGDFARRILDKAAGTAPEYAVIDDALPRRMFFNGVLCAQRDDTVEEKRQLVEVYRPPQCGLDFMISAEASDSAMIAVSFNVFAATYVPFEALPIETAPVSDFLPKLRYVRHPVSLTVDVSLRQLSAGLREISAATSDLNAELRHISDKVGALPDALVAKDGGGGDGRNIATWTKEAYDAAMRCDEKIEQSWRARIFANVTPTPLGLRVQIYLQNDSKEIKGVSAVDKNFYGAKLSVSLAPDALKEIPLERAPMNDYRYKRTVAAQGINCNTNVSPAGVIETCFAPAFAQNRYLPLPSFDLNFERMHTRPEEVFAEVLGAMEEYRRDWESRLRIGDLNIESESDLATATRFYQAFVAEQKTIQSARDALVADAQAMLAFKLMNESFGLLNELQKKRGGKAIPGWYLFQLCFMLSVVPSVLSERAEDARKAHLLWFPTGGGKTEAVMGVVVFAMFLERLRGRAFGVTSWMRFPLRLLTFQQMQRYVDLVIAADEVRSEHSATIKALASAPFTIGYFGGRRNSPNDLRYVPDDLGMTRDLFVRLRERLGRNPNAIDVLLDTEGEELFQRLLLVGDCLYCGKEGSVRIVGDVETLSLRHRCTSCKRTLPVLSVDDDIYCELPTVLVGTLDKLATIGFRIGFRTLLGKSDGRCEKHGFGTFGKCLKASYGGCSHADWRPFPKGMRPYGGISILFQDELHLINEQLGCFDAHYESLLMSLCEETSGRPPVVIAASATIEGAEHQLQHLYDAEEARFPGEGPRLRESFYAAETSDLQRTFVGIRPSNLAHLDTTMSLATFLFEEIGDLRNHRARMETFYPSVRVLSNDDYEALIDRHSLVVSYVNSKREGQNIRRSMDEQVRDALLRTGREDIYGITSLSGDSTMDQVKDALRRMKVDRRTLPDDEKLDFAVATSMISHGVDVDRLNTMIFFSYPRTTAEYIQASSRAGRTFPGLVFVVLKSTTYRDRSFYKNFVQVHEALDKMVETVPIDRFAIHAVERTVPGVATALLIQRAADTLRGRSGLSLENVRTIDDMRTLKRLVIGGFKFGDAVTADLERIYRVDDPRASDWKSDITRILKRLDVNIQSASDGASISKELNYSDTRVMTSLRDVEPPLDVYIKDRLTGSGGDDDDD